jgi:hypothetical protein
MIRVEWETARRSEISACSAISPFSLGIGGGKVWKLEGGTTLNLFVEPVQHAVQSNARTPGL